MMRPAFACTAPDDCQTDPAEAEHRHGVTSFTFAVMHRADTGGDTAAEQTDFIQRACGFTFASEIRRTPCIR